MIGIILAGGAATRLGGGDKGRHCVGGVTIFERVQARMRAQCDRLVLSVGGRAGDGHRSDLPVVADPFEERRGPLAGVLAGLDWVAAHHPHVAFAVTAPIDAPFLPRNLVARLQDARLEDRADVACARSGGRVHPVAALWSVELRHDLRKALVDENLRTAHTFLARHAVAYVDWPVEPYDPFFNANTPADLTAAETIAATHGA